MVRTAEEEPTLAMVQILELVDVNEDFWKKASLNPRYVGGFALEDYFQVPAGFW